MLKPPLAKTITRNSTRDETLMKPPLVICGSVGKGREKGEVEKKEVLAFL